MMWTSIIFQFFLEFINQDFNVDFETIAVQVVDR